MSDFNDNVLGEEDFRDDGRKSCNSRSACALKDIIDDIDQLNNKDLRVLDNVIDRILCCRSDNRKDF